MNYDKKKMKQINYSFFFRTKILEMLCSEEKKILELREEA